MTRHRRLQNPPRRRRGSILARKLDAQSNKTKDGAQMLRSDSSLELIGFYVYGVFRGSGFEGVALCSGFRWESLFCLLI